MSNGIKTDQIKIDSKGVQDITSFFIFYKYTAYESLLGIA